MPPAEQSFVDACPGCSQQILVPCSFFADLLDQRRLDGKSWQWMNEHRGTDDMTFQAACNLSSLFCRKAR